LTKEDLPGINSTADLVQAMNTRFGHIQGSHVCVVEYVPQHRHGEQRSYRVVEMPGFKSFYSFCFKQTFIQGKLHAADTKHVEWPIKTSACNVEYQIRDGFVPQTAKFKVAATSATLKNKNKTFERALAVFGPNPQPLPPRAPRRCVSQPAQPSTSCTRTTGKRQRDEDDDELHKRPHHGPQTPSQSSQDLSGTPQDMDCDWAASGQLSSGWLTPSQPCTQDGWVEEELETGSQPSQAQEADNPTMWGWTPSQQVGTFE
jgi:hypothetical protein